MEKTSKSLNCCTGVPSQRRPARRCSHPFSTDHGDVWQSQQRESVVHQATTTTCRAQDKQEHHSRNLRKSMSRRSQTISLQGGRPSKDRLTSRMEPPRSRTSRRTVAPQHQSTKSPSAQIQRGTCFASRDAKRPKQRHSCERGRRLRSRSFELVIHRPLSITTATSVCSSSGNAASLKRVDKENW